MCEHSALALPLSINWEAVSAVGTVCAIIVALFLPVQLAKREWARQDAIRQTDRDTAIEEIAGIQHQICSAVDRVLAYREAALAIFDSEPVYWVGIQAVRRININSRILLELLKLFEVRPGLTDGTAYSAVAAKQIAEATIEQTSCVLRDFGTVDCNWPQRFAALSSFDELSSMTKLRADGVRKHFGLAESQNAAEIRLKYLPLAEAIKSAKATNSGEPVNNLASSYS